MKLCLTAASILGLQPLAALGQTVKCNPEVGSASDAALALAGLVGLFLKSQYYGGGTEPVVFGSILGDGNVLAEAAYSCRDKSPPPTLLGEDVQQLLSMIGKQCPGQSGSVSVGGAKGDACGFGMVVTKNPSGCLGGLGRVEPHATSAPNGGGGGSSQVCEVTACGDSVCANAQVRARRELLGARTPTPIPRDIFLGRPEAAQLRGATEFTAPQTWPRGTTAEGHAATGEQLWWQAMKEILWTDGSHHGVDPALLHPDGPGIPSSFFLDFDTANPGGTAITGGGPVYGCTIVAVVTPQGAYTAHFWEMPFFVRPDNTPSPRFSEVLEFLRDGYHQNNEDYPGLRELAHPDGGPFQNMYDRPRESWVGIMTPAERDNPNAMRYPDQVDQIRRRVANILDIELSNINTHLYAHDGAIWDSEDGRLPRTWDQPYRGYLAILRRRNNDFTPGYRPGFQVFIENNVAATVEYDYDFLTPFPGRKKEGKKLWARKESTGTSLPLAAAAA